MESALDTVGGPRPAALMPAASRAPPCAERHQAGTSCARRCGVGAKRML